MKTILIAVTALALAGAAAAQPAAPPNISRAEGLVTAMSDSDITLAEADGKTETIKLVPGWSVSVSKAISVSEIVPGSYLGTTNHAKPDGTGTSTEVHVSPPGVKGPGVDFVMVAGTDTTMTNGVVATVVKSDGGQVLEINYGSGVRKVTVPPGTPIVLTTQGDRATVKAGAKVRVVTFGAPGSQRQVITVL
jgi:hypothetical protein